LLIEAMARVGGRRAAPVNLSPPADTVAAVGWRRRKTLAAIEHLAPEASAGEERPRPWPLDADGGLFRLVSEARRIRLAHLFDPYVAVDTSTIDPLPHQIEAVYQEMLPRLPLRFLLADDPGAGKTVMSGLYIRELIIRGDVERCLIVAPGSLVEQWRDELWSKFQLDFRVLTTDMINAGAGDPFAKHPRLIARIDQLARNDDLQARLAVSDWDLVIVDEAHKMSARFHGAEVKKTRRYRVGELLRVRTRHFLLLTATPHNGMREDFQLFMALLDPDRFAGKPRDGADPVDPSDLMRRYVKEHLLTFAGTRLFPERRANTVRYPLSDRERVLYDLVTDYVRDGMDRAQRLAEGGDRRRGLVVGFALAALQRRLASSPEAIYRSIQRRRRRLLKRFDEIDGMAEAPAQVGAPVPGLPLGMSPDDLEGFDVDDHDDAEIDELESAVIDQATAAATKEELQAEIVELDNLELVAAEVRSAGTDAKWEELRSILASAEMTGDDGARRKLIVFSEHRDTLNYLERRIRTVLGRDEAVVTIHGGMSREKRRHSQHRFIHDPDVQVLVATDAAGEGVNLQRANLMVNYDLPWNPNRIEQRFGRIHRIGQTEVCHLWNLLAEGTREGDVFDLLLAKIEEQRQVFGDQVYDVLGDSMINTSLRDLLIEAIRHRDRPEARRHREDVIDSEIGARFEEVLNERDLSAGLLPSVRVGEIRERMERAKARKLQPGFVKSFFDEAIRELGGDMVERERGRFEIRHVPAAVRSEERQVAAGAPLQERYERVTFEKGLARVEGKPVAELLAPGHPLLTAVIDTVLEQHGALLRRGAVFVDPDDPSGAPKALACIEHTIDDGGPESQGRRVVSRRCQFVEVDGAGAAEDAGHAPYLDYRPIKPEEADLVADLVEGDWIAGALNETARSYAAANLAEPHLEEVKAITEARVARVREAVEERLTSEIRRWDVRAAELRRRERVGKKPRPDAERAARRRAAELSDRFERRMRQLDQELDLADQAPSVVGGALVIPQGLLERLGGGRDRRPSDHARDVEEVDRRAVAAVIAAERSIGRIPTEMGHANPGYDVESRDPSDGKLYFIEVKGRIEGATTVTVKTRQITQAKNNPETFRLAVVIVPEDETAEPSVSYLVRPFDEHESGFAEESATFRLGKLLGRAGGPQ